MSTPYQRGRAFEYKVKKHYEKMGYFVVRSAGSRSSVDLVCLRFREVVLVQCKKDGKVSAGELSDLDKLGRELFAHCYIAMEDDDGGIRFKYINDLKGGELIE